MTGSPRAPGVVRRCLAPLVAVACAAGIVLVGPGPLEPEAGERVRAIRGMEDAALAAPAVLGGFRALAISKLWVEALNRLDEHRTYEVLPLFELLGHLQPGVARVWFFQASVAAVDIPSRLDDREARYAWLRRGILRLREGARRNPDDPRLPIWEGNILFVRLLASPRDEDAAHHRRWIREDRELNPEGHRAGRLTYEAYRRAVDLSGHSPRADHGCLRLARWALVEGLGEEASPVAALLQGLRPPGEPFVGPLLGAPHALRRVLALLARGRRADLIGDVEGVVAHLVEGHDRIDPSYVDRLLWNVWVDTGIRLDPRTAPAGPTGG